jgi:hypothetical protein
MKKALFFTLVLTLGAGLVAAQPSQAKAPAPPAEAGIALPPLAAPQTPAALPNCGLYDGNACNAPGARVRCQWAPFEPGLCFCTNAFVWACG